MSPAPDAPAERSRSDPPRDDGQTIAARFEVESTRYLAPQGTPIGALPPCATEADVLESIYRAMVLTRTFDAKAIALQRTGRLGTYASSLGQEAVSCGVGAAMDAADVLLPSFREHGTQLMRGVRVREIFLYWGGDERGSDTAASRADFPVSIPVASHVPHAVGVGMALRLRGGGRAAVCLCGDGATSKGDFYEAINAAGVWKLPIVFVVANNQWAISVPRGRQTAAETLAQKAIAAGIRGIQVDGNDAIAVLHRAREALERARSGDGPSLIEALTYRLADHTTADDARRYRSEQLVAEQWKLEPVGRLRAFLMSVSRWSAAQEQELLARCKREVEEEAEAYLATPAQPPTSMFDHLYATLPRDLVDQRTEVAEASGVDDAEGYAASAASPSGRSATPTGATSRNGAVGPVSEPQRLGILGAVNLALARAMQEDDAVLVLGEDVGINGGVFRATDGLYARFGPERVCDTPLSELLIAGMSVGLAAQGFRPVAEIQFMGFIYPALDQLVNHASRLRNRTRGRLVCPMVLRAPYGAGIGAPEHHSESTEAMFAHVPGLRVVVPSSPARAYGLLLAAIRDSDPVVFLEPKRIYRAVQEKVSDDGRALPLDTCIVLREGADITLVTWGAMTVETLAAADLLAGEGIGAEVLDLATLKPLDMDGLLASVEKTGRCVVVHEAARTGGYGGEVAARLAEHALTSLVAPIQRVTGYDTVVPLARLEKYYLPGADRIVAAARYAMEFR